MKIFFLLIFLLMANPIYANSDTIIIGWLERVVLKPANIVMHAKIDTGADNCSVHAKKISYSKDDTGHLIASFKVQNRYGESKTIKRKVIRTAKIKTKVGGLQRRPVVSIGICIDTIDEYIECNLVDRSHFDYPVLLGRNFLASNVLVDSSETYLTEPKCRKVER